MALSRNNVTISNITEVVSKRITDELADKHGMSIGFDQFVEVLGVPIRSDMIGNLFDQIHEGIPILLDDTMIEYFGYKGKIQTQRDIIIRLLENELPEEEGISWWRYTNSGYSNFVDEWKNSPVCEENVVPEHSGTSTQAKSPSNGHSDEEKSELPDQLRAKYVYPPVKTRRRTGKTIHTLVTPFVFRELLMLASTKQGKKVRKYYLVLEACIYLYKMYESAHRTKLANFNFKTEMDSQRAQFELLLEMAAESKEANVVMLKTNAAIMQVAVALKQEVVDTKQVAIALKQEVVDTKQVAIALKQVAVVLKQEVVATRQEVVDTRQVAIALNQEVVVVQDLLLDEKNNARRVASTRVFMDEVSRSKRQCITIVYDREDPDFPYYAMRVQRKSISSALKKLQGKYGKHLIKVYTNTVPNAIVFWKTVRRVHSDFLNESESNNWFNLTVTLDAFKGMIRRTKKDWIDPDTGRE
jgi:hypothetical protein